MVQGQTTPLSAFHENDVASQKTNLFLGIIQQRYVRTLHGAVHGIASMLALLLGNYLFVSQVILGMEVPSSIKSVFFLSNITSASVTILFFWDKVQSWQLATTSMKDKGLVAQQMQNFNRGRGALAMLSYSLFPMLVQLCPSELLDSILFSSVVAIATLSCTTKTFFLIQDYRRVLFFVYGMYSAAVAVAILRYGRISSLLRAYPLLPNHFEKQAYFVVSCVQFGFMWYYFYSRRLVSKEWVQSMCKNYHPIMFVAYLIRLSFDQWWASMLPTEVVIHSLLLTLFGILFLAKIVKTQLTKV